MVSLPLISAVQFELAIGPQLERANADGTYPLRGGEGSTESEEMRLRDLSEIELGAGADQGGDHLLGRRRHSRDMLTARMSSDQKQKLNRHIVER